MIDTDFCAKARLAVHFQSIAERFSPHDTVFSFNTSAELADSALSAACSLHTAPASIKSASSLRRKALAEITEDASENHILPGVNDAGEDTGLSAGANNGLTRLDTQAEIPTPPSPSGHTPSSSTPSSSTIRKNSDKALPPIPKSPETESLPGTSLDHKERPARPSLEGRRSSSSARPPTRESYERYDANGYKIKVKVGPRPSLDSTEPTPGSHNHRPVSSLPASVHMPLRKVPPARMSHEMNGDTFRQARPAPTPVMTQSISHLSPPFVKPIPSPPTPLPIRPRTSDSKTSTMTPEKRRLMKALELRQKQLAAQKNGQGITMERIPTQADGEPVAKGLPSDKTLSSEAEGSVEFPPTGIRPNESGLIRLQSADLGNVLEGNVDASPISIPETSDGPSTQASSVSDEEDPAQEKKSKDESMIAMEHPTANKDTLLGVDRYGGGPLLVAADPDRQPKNAHLGQKALRQEMRDAVVDNGAKAQPQEAHKSVLNGAGQPLPSIPAEPEHEPIRSEEHSVQQNSQKDSRPDVIVDDALPVSGETWSVGSVGSVDLPGVSNKGTGSGPSTQPSQDKLCVPPTQDTGMVKPQEVPLPPISEDEEMRLSPQPSNANEPIPQHINEAESKSSYATQDTGQPLEDNEQHTKKSNSMGTRPSTADTAGARRSVRLNRRHGLIEPVRRVSSGENSDDQFLSDDSFMEELKNTTVQEAKPVRVSRSPIFSEFPRPKSEHKAELVTNPRSVSSPVDVTNQIQDRKTPSPQHSSLQAPRAVSATQSRSLSPPEISPPMLKKLGVSSGISQRIKALETLSTRPTSPSQTLHSPANPPPVFASLGSRKSSLHSRPGTSERPSSRQSRSQTPAFELTSPKLVSPKPYNQFVSVSLGSKPGQSRPDSISVTAKIVRDEYNQTPEVPLDASEPRVVDLHRSPLMVEHRNSEVMPPPSKKPVIKRHTTAPSISSSSTDHKRESILSSKRNSIQSLSNGSRRGSEVAISRSTSEVSLSGASPERKIDEKKESRKSRILKRMSSISSASRRSIATALSPAPAREQPIAEQPEPAVQQAPIAATVDMGDVNIQFPDTLVRSPAPNVTHLRNNLIY